jgi:hypothetical protein
MKGGLIVREYEKTASRVGLLVVVTLLVVQVIANEIPSTNSMDLKTKLLIAVSIGILSFFITEIFPKLWFKEKSLCGLYIITYDNDRDGLCSIVNIEHNYQRDKYSIDVYDCYLQGSCWVSVDNQYPINLDNIFYDLSPRGLHLVSNSDNYKTCIFIRFTYKTNSGTVMRYGSQKPFNKPYSGKFKKLSPGQLCEVYNSEYKDYHFCDLHLSKYGKCKYEGRENCRKKESVVLDKVRKKGNYLKIAKVLYNSSAISTDLKGTETKSEPESMVNIEISGTTDVISSIPLVADVKVKSEKSNLYEKKTLQNLDTKQQELPND